MVPGVRVDLGPAMVPPPANIDALRTASGLYVRRYVRGAAAVNPDDRPHVLVLSGPAERVDPVGGGALDARADTPGWRLRLVPVRGRVVLPAHSGLVLISSARG